MDVARLNFSHGEYADHESHYKRVRAASDVTGRAVGILADLQGPKIRLGRFAAGYVRRRVRLWSGNRTTLTTDPQGIRKMRDGLSPRSPREDGGDVLEMQSMARDVHPGGCRVTPSGP